ncbi:hypothetical protein VDS41_18080 [Xanthomonas campestris pv. campestris]|nr:hypothetical protein [Xanthomonas campestris pv. campestris]
MRPIPFFHGRHVDDAAFYAFVRAWMTISSSSASIKVISGLVIFSAGMKRSGFGRGQFSRTPSGSRSLAQVGAVRAIQNQRAQQDQATLAQRAMTIGNQSSLITSRPIWKAALDLGIPHLVGLPELSA